MILVSACLITHDPNVANPNYLAWLAAYADYRIFLPVCPAELAGLPRMQQAELRRNRPGLLTKLHEAMNRVADLARLSA